MNKLLGLIFGLAVVSPLTAQEDSLHLRLSDVRTRYFFLSDPFRFIHTDTSLHHFQRYKPVYADTFDYFYLGNLVRPHRPVLFQFDQKPGFQTGLRHFDRYFRRQDQLKYYDVSHPFTELRYVLGTQAEQVFRMRHTQNILPDLNLAIDYQRYISGGFYQRQRSGVHDLGVSGWFRSRDHRYAVFAGLTFYSLENEENGGITLDTVFQFRPRDLAPVRLETALTEWKGLSAQLKQQYDMGTYYQEAINDSTTIRRFRATSRFAHTLHYQRREYLFRDANPDSSYYDNFFFLQDSTYDRLNVKILANTFSFSTLASQEAGGDSILEKRFQFGLNATHRLIVIEDQSTQVRQEGLLSAYFESNPYRSSRFRFSARAEVTSRADFQLKGLISLHFPEWGYIRAGLLNASVDPDLVQQRLFSNHYLWYNDFRKTEILRGSFEYHHPAWQLKATARSYLLNDYIYWSTEVTPRQEERELVVWQFLLEKDFTAGNFHFENTFAVQTENSRSRINLPLYWSKHSIYYEGMFFKGALLAQLGIDLRYNTNFFAYAYEPAIAQFYLQEDEELEFYPVVDVFFNAQINKARLFFKIEHVNEGLIWDGYFAAPGYPMPDRWFKFGVSWYFFY